MSLPGSFRLTLPACLVAVAVGAGVASAQEAAAPKYAEWRLFEAGEETAAYRTTLREGGFDAAARDFLVQQALPQLALKRNRAAIDRVRRRMREVLCGDGGSNAAAAESARKVIADSMTVLARKADAELIVRVNAMLFLGELATVQGKPWPAAAAPLAAALGDDSLPGAVRIAASAGLARHTAEAGDALAPTVGPVLVKALSTPSKGLDAVGTEWLQSRALAMLADLGPAAPADAVTAAAAILADDTRSIDLRVRAAAVLGRCAKAGQIDGAKTVATITALATAAVETDRARERRARLVQGLSGQAASGLGRPDVAWQPDGGVAGVPSSTAPSQSYRRTAWRMATLADALLSADGTGGLALVAGNEAQAARDLAAALRQAAMDLDALPEEASLAAAIEALGLAVDGETADGEAAPAEEAPAETVDPAAPPFTTPFGG